jgi:hypothetical protein
MTVPTAPGLLDADLPANARWIAEVLPALKSGYDRPAATAALIGGVTKYSRYAADWGPFFAQDVYDPAVYDPADRERVIVAHFSATFQMYPMAIHIWWGMVEGLPFDEVTRTFLITGSYAGIWSFTQSCGLFAAWIAAMDALWTACEAAGAPNVPWSVALAAMAGQFNSGLSTADAVAAAIVAGRQSGVIPPAGAAG